MPTDRFPVVTVMLILANALMYFLFQDAGIFEGPNEANVVEYGVVPYELTNPGQQCELAERQRLACEGQELPPGAVEDQPPTWLTVFTSMFMHGSIVHLGGNMLFLWIFGNNIEDSMNRLKYLLFYLLGGIAAVAAQTAIDPDAAIPTIGASGAVSAVLGGYLVLYPRARVVTVVFFVFFFTLIELPALLVLGFWFVQQLLFGYFDLNAGGEGGGVAYFAHIGGFVFGMLVIRFIATRRKTPPHLARRRLAQ